MASNTSKTARASVRAGQSAGGALSVLGEFKYLIPLNGGKHAYVRNLTNGKTSHLRTESEAFVEEIRVLVGSTANRFLPGHRIRLDISSSNFPRFDPNTNSGRTIASDTWDDVVPAINRVFHDGARPSRLLLPVIERD